MSNISIALCTYNGAKFLPEQLESFLTQSRLPDELVINDDCSTDETAEIIQNFAKTSPFPLLLEINEKNLGSTANFERVISRCSGDLIFLADQDDVWLPEKISRMEDAFAADPDIALAFSDAELVDENLQWLGSRLWDFTFPEEKQRLARGGKMFEVLLDQNVVTGATAVFRSSFRKVFTPIPTNIPNLIHDGWIALTAAATAEIIFVDEPLIKYRQHSNQQLGINFQVKKKRNYTERQKFYANSIRFFQNEELRLMELKKVFSEHPAFEKQRDANLIDKLTEEKQQLVKHYEARKNLPVNRLQRFAPVFAETKSGRYRRFSQGFLSAAKDLLEKW